MSRSSTKTWMITGAGRGLGRAFAEAALQNGDTVVATARDRAALADLSASHPDSLLVLTLDVRDRSRSREVVQRGFDRFGRIDVLVNNAGYGLVGTVEELTEEEIRAQVETNFLGALWTTQAVLPLMREQGGGEIVQISTTGAVGTMPAFGLYNASKWALEGFSEALAAEVASFGIRVTIAELGGFDTDWGSKSLKFSANLPAYDALRSSVFGTDHLPWDLDADDADSSEADPAEAAAALQAHLAEPGGPLRLIVGEDAPAHIAMALEARRDDYELDPRFSWPEPAK